MRNIDWSKKLTADDIAWLRQAGIPYVGPLRTEDAIQDNAKRFKFTPVGEEILPDTVTRSVLDPSGRASEGVVATSETAMPSDSDGGESETDDYDQKSVTDLVSIVRERNAKAEADGSPHVEVTGTGTDGKVRKADLVKGLRLHDQIG